MSMFRNVLGGVNIFGGNFSLNLAGGSADPGTVTVRPDHDIYYNQLLLKQKGCPMWIPGPDLNLPEEYRRRGIAVGDVGILYCAEGFTFLFNIFLPAHHPINRGRVPEGFEHLDFARVSQGRRLQNLGQREYTSSSVRKLSTLDSSNFTFETSTEGAILVTPDGGISEDLFSLRTVKNYLAQHAESWYEFVRDGPFELEVDNRDIRLVVGTDKVSSWGIATVPRSVSDSVVRLSFFRQGDGPSAAYRMYDWNFHGSAQARRGPDEETMDGLRRDSDISPLRNQCVFVRTLSFELSGKIWTALGIHRIRSELSESVSAQPADPSPAPGSSDDTATAQAGQGQVSGGHSTNSKRSAIDNPSDMINSWLLKQNPTARIAITGDSDWISVIGTDAKIPTWNEICSRVINNHEICEKDGIVTVAPPHQPSLSDFMQPIWQSMPHKAKNSRLYFICIGPHGTGKSKFIDTLTAETSWRNHNVTRTPLQFRSADIKSPIGNRNVTLIDTPGFDDSFSSVAGVFEQITGFIKRTSQQKVLTVFILYFHNITTNGLTLPPATSLLEQLCGKCAAHQFVVVTTHWDRVAQDTGAAREAELKARFKGLTVGATWARFDTTAESAWKIIERLLFSHNDTTSVSALEGGSK